jgi:putative membrane protein
MPEEVIKEMWALIPTIVYFVVGLLLFGFSVWLMEKVTPFSIRKEIEADQNVALGIVIGAALIALAILLAAVIK